MPRASPLVPEPELLKKPLAGTPRLAIMFFELRGEQQIPMFRDRPLTWLFVIATVVVDLTLTVARSSIWEYRDFVVGYVLGQVAALAIWTVRGRVHRLLRASCFVLATRLLVSILDPEPTTFALISVVAAAIFIFALLVEILRTLQDDAINQKKRWQFPLIEFFGWTIVVAVVSLGCRNMEFDFLDDTDFWLFLAALFVVPLLLVLCTLKDLRDLKRAKALTIVGAAIVVVSYGTSFIFDVLAQAVYLVAWMTVLTLDNIFFEAAETRGSKGDSNEPKLFNPQD